jgi:hypothetical protein
MSWASKKENRVSLCAGCRPRCKFGIIIMLHARFWAFIVSLNMAPNELAGRFVSEAATGIRKKRIST